MWDAEVFRHPTCNLYALVCFPGHAIQVQHKLDKINYSVLTVLVVVVLVFVLAATGL
jgi:hypothetical protein